jgi:transposase-like protein
MSEKRKQYSKEFKLAALARMEAGTNVTELAAELGVTRKDLYAWRTKMRMGGEELVGRPVGRPRKPEPKPAEIAAIAALQRQVAELERKLGRKQLEVDFLKRTFEHVREAMQPSADSGGERSTSKSEPRFRTKGSR